VAIADAALGAAKAVGRDMIGYINLAIDVSPTCDCVGYADRPIVPNIGVFASLDPVAIDTACVDAVTASPGMPGSLAEQNGVAAPGVIKHSACSSLSGNSQFLQLRTGVKNGLGSMEYELEVIGQLESARPYVYNPSPGSPVPIGARLNPIFNRAPFFPERGFERTPSIDFEELR
jgi:hypothetical protein